MADFIGPFPAISLVPGDGQEKARPSIEGYLVGELTAGRSQRVCEH